MVAGSLNALDSVVSWLAGVPGRKAVLYVSDGLPITPGLDLYTIWSRAPKGTLRPVIDEVKGRPTGAHPGFAFLMGKNVHRCVKRSLL
jgi:hypothetical protein